MSKSENNHDNSDFQMLKEEISESEYQNAQYEAEKKKHMSYWVMIIAPFIMILVIFIETQNPAISMPKHNKCRNNQEVTYT